jgi:hypothetical protein
MDQNTVLDNKYIREDDPELEQSVEYINYLVDAYKQTDEPEYRDALLDEFDGYFKKYVGILYSGNKVVDISNKDTKNFLRLFMSPEDRATEESYRASAGKYILMVRRVMKTFSPDDIYHELIVLFLEFLEKYKPITYIRKSIKHRISFAHYIQVNIRYHLCKLIVKNSNDCITGRNCLEFNDCLEVEYSNNNFQLSDVDTQITLKDWVWGNDAGFPFTLLTDFERYLLWLRHESDPWGVKITTREMASRTGFHERTIIYKLKKIKQRIEESIDG